MLQAHSCGSKQGYVSFHLVLYLNNNNKNIKMDSSFTKAEWKTISLKSVSLGDTYSRVSISSLVPSHFQPGKVARGLLSGV